MTKPAYKLANVDKTEIALAARKAVKIILTPRVLEDLANIDTDDSSLK